MQTINRASGLQITLPEDYQVPPVATAPLTASPTRRRGLGGARGAIPLPAASENDPVVAAFEQQEMILLDQLDLTPDASATATRSRGARSGEAEFSVPLAADENAVLLLEQDGMYTWQLPEDLPAKSVAASRNARRGVGASQATFRVALPSATQSATPSAAAARRGLIGNFVRDKIKAYVFKFAARAGLTGLVKFLERNTRTGIVNLSGDDAGQWPFINDLTTLTLPTDRPARILLFVHGTFSSTVGGFGALTVTPWGEKFLEAARANYDAIIGFDHPTLSEDPFANANELLTRLEGRQWPFAPQIDIITHSRGGLVTRTLIEQLLPMSPLKPRIGQVIFVAATNGGTLLASPQNWKALIDLYTNLVAGTTKLLQMLPKAHLAALILNEAVQSVGALLKFAAANALTDNGVPGLAAMQPDGPVVTQINQTQPGQPTAQQSFYFAVTSQFKAKLTGDHQPSELPKRLLQMLETGFVSELMREANDLVVNTASMTTIDPQAGKFIKDSLDFNVSPQVYHTNYFLQPKVADALTRWLSLIEPAPVATSTKRSVKGVRGAIKTTSNAAAPGSLAVAATARRQRPAGEAPEITIPAIVDTDILIVDAEDTAAELRRMLEARLVSFVVVRRVYYSELLNYAFKYEEALRLLSPNDKRTVLDALNLHESDKSDTRSVSDDMMPPSSTGGSPTKGRSVITANGQPVGVLPESVEPLTAEQIAELARKTANPKNIEERAQGQRAMPTFMPLRQGITNLSAPAEPSTKRSQKETFESVPSAPPGRSRGARGSKGSGKPISFNFPTSPPAPAAPPKSVRSAKPVAAAAKATCFFQAAMDDEVIVKRITNVEVTISREEIEQIAGTVSSQGKAEAEVDRKIVVQVIPRKNFELIGEGIKEVDLPAPNNPAQLVFNLRPTNAGDGEVWIKVRQGQVALVSLKLKSQIVAAANAGQGKGRTVASQAAAEAQPLEAPLHMLEIFDLSRFGKSAFQFTFESPQLGIRIRRESNPINGDVQKYIADLYQKIEDRWLSAEEDFENFTQEMRALGVDLFEQLIPKDLQQTLWDHRKQISSIRVISTEPFVPWEMVHLKEPGKSLPPETLFLGQMGLVRWLDLDSNALPPEQLLIRKGRSLYVIPNYPHPDYKLPEALEEAKFLTKAFGATAVTPKSSDVRKLISQPGAFDLLHFACHGEADSNNIAEAQLLMEGRIENNQFIIDALTETVVNGFANLQAPDNRPLIVLNACQAGRAGRKLTGMGGFAQAFLQHGAGAFVGALWSVGDSPARSFTESLYAQLRKGATLADATIAAREEARKAGDATWLAYVVYGHPHLRLK